MKNSDETTRWKDTGGKPTTKMGLDRQSNQKQPIRGRGEDKGCIRQCFLGGHF